MPPSSYRKKRPGRKSSVAHRYLSAIEGCSAVSPDALDDPPTSEWRYPKESPAADVPKRGRSVETTRSHRRGRGRTPTRRDPQPLDAYSCTPVSPLFATTTKKLSRDDSTALTQSTSSLTSRLAGTNEGTSGSAGTSSRSCTPPQLRDEDESARIQSSSSSSWRRRLEGTANIAKQKQVSGDTSWIKKKAPPRQLGAHKSPSKPLTEDSLKERFVQDASTAPTEVMMNISRFHHREDQMTTVSGAATDVITNRASDKLPPPQEGTDQADTTDASPVRAQHEKPLHQGEVRSRWNPPRYTMSQTPSRSYPQTPVDTKSLLSDSSIESSLGSFSPVPVANFPAGRLHQHIGNDDKGSGEGGGSIQSKSLSSSVGVEIGEKNAGSNPVIGMHSVFGRSANEVRQRIRHELKDGRTKIHSIAETEDAAVAGETEELPPPPAETPPLVPEQEVGPEEEQHNLLRFADAGEFARGVPSDHKAPSSAVSNPFVVRYNRAGKESPAHKPTHAIAAAPSADTSAGWTPAPLSSCSGAVSDDFRLDSVATPLPEGTDPVQPLFSADRLDIAAQSPFQKWSDVNTSMDSSSGEGPPEILRVTADGSEPRGVVLPPPPPPPPKKKSTPLQVRAAPAPELMTPRSKCLASGKARRLALQRRRPAWSPKKQSPPVKNGLKHDDTSAAALKAIGQSIPNRLNEVKQQSPPAQIGAVAASNSNQLRSPNAISPSRAFATVPSKSGEEPLQTRSALYAKISAKNRARQLNHRKKSFPDEDARNRTPASAKASAPVADARAASKPANNSSGVTDPTTARTNQPKKIDETKVTSEVRMHLDKKVASKALNHESTSKAAETGAKSLPTSRVSHSDRRNSPVEPSNAGSLSRRIPIAEKETGSRTVEQLAAEGSVAISDSDQRFQKQVRQMTQRQMLVMAAHMAATAADGEPSDRYMARNDTSGEKTDGDDGSIDVQSLRSLYENSLGSRHSDDGTVDSLSVESIRSIFESQAKKEDEPSGKPDEISGVQKMKAMFETQETQRNQRAAFSESSNLKDVFAKFEKNREKQKRPASTAVRKPQSKPAPSLVSLSNHEQEHAGCSSLPREQSSLSQNSPGPGTLINQESTPAQGAPVATGGYGRLQGREQTKSNTTVSVAERIKALRAQQDEGNKPQNKPETTSPEGATPKLHSQWKRSAAKISTSPGGDDSKQVPVKMAKNPFVTPTKINPASSDVPETPATVASTPGPATPESGVQTPKSSYPSIKDRINAFSGSNTKHSRTESKQSVPVRSPAVILTPKSPAQEDSQNVLSSSQESPRLIPLDREMVVQEKLGAEPLQRPENSSANVEERKDTKPSLAATPSDKHSPRYIKKEEHKTKSGGPLTKKSFNLGNSKSAAISSTESDYDDGVTLDLSIAEISALTNPTCLLSKDGIAYAASTSSTGKSSSDVFSGVNEAEGKGPSEASSSQMSEAAAPLIASMRFSRSDDPSVNPLSLKKASSRHQQNSKFEPNTRSINEVTPESNSKETAWDLENVNTIFPTTDSPSFEAAFAFEPLESDDWKPFQSDTQGAALSFAAEWGAPPSKSPLSSETSRERANSDHTPKRQNRSSSAAAVNRLLHAAGAVPMQPKEGVTTVARLPRPKQDQGPPTPRKPASVHGTMLGRTHPSRQARASTAKNSSYPPKRLSPDTSNSKKQPSPEKTSSSSRPRHQKSAFDTPRSDRGRAQTSSSSGKKSQYSPKEPSDPKAFNQQSHSSKRAPQQPVHGMMLGRTHPSRYQPNTQAQSPTPKTAPHPPKNPSSNANSSRKYSNPSKTAPRRPKSTMESPRPDRGHSQQQISGSSLSKHAALIMRIKALKEARLRRANVPVYPVDRTGRDHVSQRPPGGFHTNYGGSRQNRGSYASHYMEKRTEPYPQGDDEHSASTRSSTRFGGNNFEVCLELD